MQKCLPGIRFFLIIHLSIYVPHIQMSISPYPNPFLTQHSDTATTKSVKYPTSIYLYFSHLAPKLPHPDVLWHIIQIHQHPNACKMNICILTNNPSSTNMRHIDTDHLGTSKYANIKMFVFSRFQHPSQQHLDTD